MQALTTKYLGPTNHRGSRIKVRAARGSITVSWDDALDVEQNHVRAAREALTRWGWDGVWVGGGLPDTTGEAFVCCIPNVPLRVCTGWDARLHQHAPDAREG